MDDEDYDEKVSGGFDVILLPFFVWSLIFD